MIWQTLWLFRRFAIPETAYPLVSYILASDPHRYQPGPCGLFLQRLHQIAWAWMGEGVVRDHDGFCFHIAKCPPQLLKQRVSEAWHSMVLSEVSCRDGFEGLETCNVQLTTERLHHYSHEQMGLLRVALNRTFFTRDKLIHSGHFTSTACPWCSEPRDSIFHRHWECPHFQNSRSMVDSAVFHQLPELSDCALQHGWVGLSPVLNEFRQCLDLAPDLTQDFHVDASSMTTLYLFTDGSCLNPRCPFSWIASWGVVCADLENDVFQEVSQGPLQGLHQTIFRAECVAVISAVKFGLHARKPFWIWVDNLQVYNLMKAIRLGRPVPIHNGMKDCDLISEMCDLLRQAMVESLFEDVSKVCSHQDHTLAESNVQRWVFRGNDAADRCSERGRAAFPSRTFSVRDALVAELHNVRTIRDALHCHFIQIGQQAVADKSFQLTDEPERWEEQVDAAPEFPPDVVVSFQGFDITCPRGPLEFLGPTGPLVLQWLDELLGTPEGTMTWTTGLHLLTDFQRQTGQLGVWRNPDTKCWEPYTLSMVGHQYDFQTAARQFSAVLRAVGRVFGVQTRTYSQRPTGSSFRRWTKCILLKLPFERIAQVDRLWFQARISPVDQISKSFRNYPGSFVSPHSTT